jgi:hypothetical protein
MNDKRLHIVSFNIPYPPDYGGVIDVFYKLEALAANQVKIIFHAFEYGRKPAVELEKYCEKVYYYPRKTGILSQFSTLPYIVFSRRNKDLLANLLKDDAPILFEGLHSCYYLNHPLLKDRLKIVRIHNIEHLYYQGLAKNSHSLFSKCYFALEAAKLKRFEKQLHQANYLLTLSTVEKEYLEEKFGEKKVAYIPLFFREEASESIEDFKFYVLYHGDLSTPENEKAATFLIQSVAPGNPQIQWIFAGRNPGKTLLKLADRQENVSIRANLKADDLSQLIREAAVNILYTTQISGVKVKLLHALYNGRHCLANSAMVAGSGLETLCRIIPDHPDEILEIVEECMQENLSESEIIRRRTHLNQIYDNQKNALKIKELLP